MWWRRTILPTTHSINPLRDELQAVRSSRLMTSWASGLHRLELIRIMLKMIIYIGKHCKALPSQDPQLTNNQLTPTNQWQVSDNTSTNISWSSLTQDYQMLSIPYHCTKSVILSWEVKQPIPSLTSNCSNLWKLCSSNKTINRNNYQCCMTPSRLGSRSRDSHIKRGSLTSRVPWKCHL